MPAMTVRAPGSSVTLLRQRQRSQQAAILAAAIAQGHRPETAVALAGIDPGEAAVRLLRALRPVRDSLGRFPAQEPGFPSGKGASSARGSASSRREATVVR